MKAFPPDHPIHAIDMEEKLLTAEEIISFESDVHSELNRAKSGKAVGLNNISTALVKH